MRQLLLGLGAAGLATASCGDPVSATDLTTIHTVQRGDLVITVRERAEVQAAEDTRITSGVEGRATLIHLIEEGTVVEKGQKVAELDASPIEERRATQAISVAKADAALQQARKNLEIMEKELRSLRMTAETRLQIARLRLEKFLGEEVEDRSRTEGTNRELLGKLADLVQAQAESDPKAHAKGAGLVGRVAELLKTDDNLDLAMGEMANQILQSIDEISLARADLEMAKDTLGHSRRLFDKGFITKNELTRDEINHRRHLSKVTVSWNNLQLLVKYTLPETMITLEREIENAQLALDSTIASNEARRVREAAEFDAWQQEFQLAKERLDNYDEQIANAVLRAPGPGLVVYGRYDWDEPVYEGMEVRERQEIIILPNISTMIAEIKVHEAQIDKVALGQPATVKVDAFPERTFSGRVSWVSSLPDPNRRNRDLKVFGVKVLLEEDNESGTLRPGMNATVVIDVGTIEDVLQVPLPAVRRTGDLHYVWRFTPDGPVAAPVELGSNNLTHVEVIAGLHEGDQVYLVRPPGVMPPDNEAEATRDEEAMTGESTTGESTTDESATEQPAAVEPGPDDEAGGGSR